MRYLHTSVAMVLLSGLWLAACADPIPANPTWFGEVREILAANCVRCHSGRPLDGLADEQRFRLDRHVELDLESIDTFDRQSLIPDRALNFATTGDKPMPPTATLSDREKQILSRWVENGYPRGERTRNQAPQVELIEPAVVPESVDQELDLQLRSFDADGDGLIVDVGYRLAGSANPLTLFSLEPGQRYGGLVNLTINTAPLTSKERFDLVVVLDDGFSPDPVDNKTEVALLSNLLVDHGARGTAPSVTLLSPNSGVVGPAETAISWLASDPDVGDEILAISLELVPVNTDGSLGTPQAIANGAGLGSPYTWDLSGLQAGPDARYKVRVSASDTDNKNTSTDDSDGTFIIDASDPNNCSTTGWLDVQEFFVRVCGGCHGSPPAMGVPSDFRLDKYSADDPAFPGNTTPGVYEKRDRVLIRLANGTMPKANASEQPTSAEIALVTEWIGGCAPYDSGGGPMNDAPTFTWMTPSDSSPMPTLLVGNAIEWSAADSDGTLASGSIEYSEVTAMGPQQNYDNFNCKTGFDQAQPPNANWQTLTADLPTIIAGTTTVSLAAGYYCFRGSVSDDGGASSQTQTARSVVQIP